MTTLVVELGGAAGLQRILPGRAELMGGGLVTMERAQVILCRPA